jgi:hypothetical protein
MSSFVDSKHKKLSQEEIIKIAAKETGSEYTADQIKASLVAEAHQLKALMLREGNTIFVVHQDPKQPTAGIFRAINADTVPNYLKNSQMFIKAVGMVGFKMLISQFKDASLLNIFKYVARNAPFKNMGYRAEKSKDGMYTVVVTMGDVPPPKRGK